MNLLILGNDLDVVVNIGGETGLGEVVRGEVGKTITVELVLEVLEGQGVVKDVRVSDSGHSLTDSNQAEQMSICIRSK